MSSFVSDEDVALQRRLTLAGGLALYLGGITASHAPRSLPARLGRAFAYGYSAASLRRRLPRILPGPRALATILSELLPAGPLLVPSLAALALVARARLVDPWLLPLALARALEALPRLANRHGALLAGLLWRRTRPQAVLLATMMALLRRIRRACARSRLRARGEDRLPA